MKFSVLAFFVVAWLTESVLASDRAGPRQVVFFWNVYEMQVKAGIKPLASCNPAAPRTSCSFKEFITQTQRVGENKVGWNGEGMDDTYKPTSVEEGSQKLKSVGYESVHDPQKLDPGGNHTPGKTPSLGTLLRPHVDAAKTAINSPGGGPKIKAEYDMATQAMEDVHDMRKADQAENLIADLPTAFAKRYPLAGVTYVVEHDTAPKTLPDGTKYEEINWTKTVATNGAVKPKQAQFAADYVTKYNDETHVPPKGDQMTGPKHQKGLVDVQSFISELKTARPPNCT